MLLFTAGFHYIPLYCSQDGKFEVVANAAGDRVTPAVVAYDMEVVSHRTAYNY